MNKYDAWLAWFTKVNDKQRDLQELREKQRKHEATHGWRNPPSIYEEDQ